MGSTRGDVHSEVARRVTSYDVAKLAGVSQSTVSRCFHQGAPVSSDTRSRITRAAQTLGYAPNAIARGLITRRSNIVAIVISNLMNLHYPEVLTELTTRLAEKDLRVLLFTLASDQDTDAALDQMGRYQVDGAIVVARLLPHHVEAFAKARMPFVLYNRDVEGCSVHAVHCDSHGGEAELVEALLAGGARRFGLILGPASSTVGEARHRGAAERLAAAGIVDVPMARGDFSYASGRAAASRLLATATFDAIIAANDSMALGTMDAARYDHGLDIPRQLSVVGFDGIGPAGWGSFQLTTMRQPVQAMAEAAVEILIEQFNDPDLEVRRRVFECAYVKGASIRTP